MDLGPNFNTCDDLICNTCLAVGFVAQPQRRLISVRWAPPPFSFIKVNSDGSEVNGQLQGGVVYRNCMEFVESAFAKRMGAWKGL